MNNLIDFSQWMKWIWNQKSIEFTAVQYAVYTNCFLLIAPELNLILFFFFSWVKKKFGFQVQFHFKIIILNYKLMPLYAVSLWKFDFFSVQIIACEHVSELFMCHPHLFFLQKKSSNVDESLSAHFVEEHKKNWFFFLLRCFSSQRTRHKIKIEKFTFFSSQVHAWFFYWWKCFKYFPSHSPQNLVSSTKESGSNKWKMRYKKKRKMSLKHALKVKPISMDCYFYWRRYKQNINYCHSMFHL